MEEAERRPTVSLVPSASAAPAAAAVEAILEGVVVPGVRDTDYYVVRTAAMATEPMATKVSLRKCVLFTCIVIMPLFLSSSSSERNFWPIAANF